MTYRREIDGLRAIAVLPVILFHAGFGVFSGGYVGVDVFFVISGYLITTILIDELQRGDFSILRFYERRARRILPALFVVMAATAPFAWLWMSPSEVKAYAQSVVAVVTFCSNILFWSQEGYFATAAELKPLLHTWSLAVEEQFYLLFPLLLAALWRFGRSRVLWVIVGIAVISLLACEMWVRQGPSATFYFITGRAWELLAGSICALIMTGREQKSSNAISVLGIALILIAIFSFDNTTPFPSLYALAPVLGASLVVLFAGPATWVARVLSTAPLVGIGLISYSAYLWHQPLFAFARIRSISDPSQALMLSLAVASLVLAYGTWRFVETPFRRKLIAPTFLSDRTAVFRASAFASAAFVAAGLWANYAAIPEGSSAIESTGGRCNVGREDCFHVDRATLNVALWGDSFADAFAVSLGEKLKAKGVNFGLFIQHSCPSLIGVMRNEDSRLGAGQKFACRAHNEAARAKIVASGFDTVILTSAYQWYSTALNSNREPILIGAEGAARVSHQANVVAESLAATAKLLTDAGLKVIVVTPHPSVAGFAARKKAVRFGSERQILADYEGARRTRDALVRSLHHSGVAFSEVNGLDFYCQNERCPVIDEHGQFLLVDGSHISTYLAGSVADRVIDAIVAPIASRD